MHARDYQLAFQDAVLKTWGEPGFEAVDLEHKYADMVASLGKSPFKNHGKPSSRKTVGDSPTSSGKTIMAAMLAQTVVDKLGGRLLFVADREELIQQPVEKFHKAVGIISSIERGQDRAAMGADVVVTSVQTMGRPNRQQRFPRDHFTHIIDDEAHRNINARQRIHDYFSGAKVLGMTATAFRKDEPDLSKWYESTAFSLGPFDLVNQGYITPIRFVTAALDVDLRTVRQEKGDFDQRAVDGIMRPLYPQIAAKIREHAANMTILAFAPLIVSSKEFVEVMRSEDITAEHCDGGHHDRKGVLEAFERGDFQILSNSQVFSTGVDFIRCNCLLNLAPTRSPVEFRQRAGRIMRLAPGIIDPGGVVLPTPELRRAAIAAGPKPECIILDLLWQTSKIGLAGPASLFDFEDKEEEKELVERIKKQRTPEDLQEMRRKVQQDRERKLKEALERAAKETEKKAAAAAREEERRKLRTAGLRDAKELVLDLYDAELSNYAPRADWERQAPSTRQQEDIAGFGFDASTLTRGHATKVLEAIVSRQARGLAPVEAFAALKAAGVYHPSQCTLDHAIVVLRDGFPMTFGHKYRGLPLREVPKSFWSWLMYNNEPATRNSRQSCQARHPSAWRYMTKIALADERSQQPELAI